MVADNNMAINVLTVNLYGPCVIYIMSHHHLSKHKTSYFNTEKFR